MVLLIFVCGRFLSSRLFCYFSPLVVESAAAFDMVGQLVQDAVGTVPTSSYAQWLDEILLVTGAVGVVVRTFRRSARHGLHTFVASHVHFVLRVSLFCFVLF